MKFLFLAVAIIFMELVLDIQGAEVNNTEMKPTSNNSSTPEKRSIGNLLLPLLSGLTGMANEESYGSNNGGAGGGLLGMIGSLLSNRMGLGGGGLKLDINTKPPVDDNHGSSSNNYGGSASSPSIAFNLDFGKIHENLEKGIRIGKAAVSTGGNILGKLLQAQASNQHYSMGPMPPRNSFPEPLSHGASMRDSNIDLPPRHGRQRAPSRHLGLRGGSAEASHFHGGSHLKDDYSDIITGRKPHHPNIGTAHLPFYSETIGSNPPSFSGSLRSNSENLRSSPSSHSETLRSSQANSESLGSRSQSYPGSFEGYQESALVGPQEVFFTSNHRQHQATTGSSVVAQHQGYPSENEISTGNQQREEFGASRQTHLSSYSQPVPQDNIKPVIAVPIGLYESTQNFGPATDNRPASEYRADYDHGVGGDIHNHGDNFQGPQYASNGGSGQVSSSYMQQQQQQQI